MLAAGARTLWGWPRSWCVDHAVVKRLNLSRIVGVDACEMRRRGAKKVEVARQAVPGRSTLHVRFTGIDGDVADLAVARRLVDLDFLFLATDTITSRLVFNAIVHRFLVPGIQIGAKVELRPGSSEIEEIYVAVRPVLARPTAACACAGRSQTPIETAGERPRRSEETRGAELRRDGGGRSTRRSMHAERDRRLECGQHDAVRGRWPRRTAPARPPAVLPARWVDHDDPPPPKRRVPVVFAQPTLCVRRR